ncbi:MAG: hypothetical protein Q4G50_01900 [Corynebacterium sp.]|uniref:hypothetical protein n=1 Tax=Corynebacterium sp. TaxID=1720 RepID=UPI0026DF1669|nr:hypothetical protein [Corynebacterium sp.]MDO5668735.1 hypothetical protein [Corynebacterium sp.]
MILRGIEAASLAPSAHNAQPWQPRIIDEHTVELGVDPQRRLPVADPHDHDLLLGLGCWVEAFAIGVGRAVEVEGTTVRITAEPYPWPYTVDDLRHRQVDRGRLTPDRLAVEEVMRAEEELRVIPEALWRSLAPRATAHMASSREMLAETFGWLRLNPRDPRYRQDGLTAECLRIPRPVAWMLHHLQPSLLRSRRVWRPLLNITWPAGESPTRLVLAGEPGIAKGRQLLRIWLALDARGLRVAVHSEFKDQPECAAQLAQWLGDTPCAVFSAGRSTSATVPRAGRR